MSISFKPVFITVVILSFLSVNVDAVTENEERETYYWGVYKNRVPYSYRDEDNEYKGILLDRINTLCEHMKVNCEYTSGNYHDLLNKVKNYQLHGVLVIDHVIDKGINSIKLTAPLCDNQPVFTQHRSDSTENEKSPTVGVRYDSLLHNYLQKETHVQRVIKPYITLENAIFDLKMERINTLFVDKSFFDARVLLTSLANDPYYSQLDIQNIEESDAISSRSMRLAIRSEDTELSEDLEDALGNSGKTHRCSALLSQNNLNIKPLSDINYADD